MATQQELDIVVKLQDEASEKMKGIAANAKTLGVSFTAVGVAITGSLGYAVSKAAEAQVAMANFDATLKATGTATDAIRDQLLKAADGALKYGFDNEAAANSLAKFYQRTNDVKKATELNMLAMDLARAKHIDLGAATNLVNMALSGSGKALMAYGINIKEAATPLEALGELHKAVGGQADAFSKTLTGSTEALSETFGDLVEEIGGVLIPILTKLVEFITPVIEKVVAWVREHPKLTEAIVITAGVIGLLATGLGALLLILPMVTTGLATFAAVFGVALGPVLLVIGAIALLITWLTWLYFHVDDVKKNWIAVWTILKNNIVELSNQIGLGIKFAWDGIAEYFRILWDGIKAIFKAAFDWIMDTIVNPIMKAISSVYNGVTGLARSVGANLSAAGAIIGENVSALGKVMGFADGGVVPGAQGDPMLAVVHGGETVTPPGKMGPGGINVYVTGNNISNQLDLDNLASQVGRQIVNDLRLSMKLSI